jgi:hypothetical protein
MALEIQDLVWDRHTNVVGLASYLYSIFYFHILKKYIRQEQKCGNVSYLYSVLMLLKSIASYVYDNLIRLFHFNY